MTRIPALLLALAVAVAPRSSSAAEQPGGKPSPHAAPAASPIAQEIARLLIPESNWNKSLDGYASTLSQQMSGALAAGGQKPPGDLEPKVRSELGGAMTYQQVVDLEAQALTKRFSPQELASIQKFYQSPAGKKVLTELPTISREVSDEVQTRLSARVPQIVEKYAPSLAKKGPPPGAPSAPAQGRTPPPADSTHRP